MLRRPYAQLFRRPAPSHILGAYLRHSPRVPGFLPRTFTSTQRPATQPSRWSRLWQLTRTRAAAAASRQVRRASSKTSAEFRPEKTKSMSDRMKEMTQKYGWVVVGTYLGLSALDYPFCFLAVRWFGADRIAGIEHAILDKFWVLLEKVVPSLEEKRKQKEAQAAAEEATEHEGGSKEHGEASIWTQALIAYGVHKSLFFIRIPVTLAILPRVIKTLRGWGFKVGKSATA